MSNAVKNIVIRVIKARLEEGGKFEDAIKAYPRLTKDEVREIKAALAG